MSAAEAVTPGGPSAATRRVKGLDALRGVAATAVVLHHYTSNYERLYHHRTAALFSLSWGALGVQLFFVISGFVILMSLERAAGAGAFVRSRLTRLYPAYWAAVVLTFVVVVRAVPQPRPKPSLATAFVNLSMVQHLAGVVNVDGVYWTLHVELTFYAIMAIVAWAGWVRRAELVLLAVVSAAATVRAGAVRPDIGAWHVVRVVRHWEVALGLDHMATFLIGLCVYRLAKGTGRDGGRSLARPLAVLPAAMAIEWAVSSTLDFWATALFAVAVYLAASDRLGWLQARPVLFLGYISYALYLTHQRIGFSVIYQLERLGVRANLAVALAIVVAVLIALAVTELVERPALRLIRCTGRA